MTAQKLDGRATAKTITQELSERVAALQERGVTPGIATVLVEREPSPAAAEVAAPDHEEIGA